MTAPRAHIAGVPVEEALAQGGVVGAAGVLTAVSWLRCRARPAPRPGTRDRERHASPGPLGALSWGRRRLR
jgi:hypothetical protein